MNKSETSPSEATEKLQPENETLTFSIPHELSEWVRNYHYSKILETGNIGLTLKDVVIEAFTALKQTTKLNIKVRPEEVRIAEKRVGRKRKN